MYNIVIFINTKILCTHLEKLQTQQVGLRLATHLVEEIDDLIKDFNLNRTSFIAEAIKECIAKQKTYQR